MATKKKKRRSRARKTGPKGFLIAPAILLCIVTILGLFYYLSDSTSTMSPPPFEEAYTRTSDLDEKIKRVDHAIYESLYQRGVPEKDILFLTVEPKHTGNDEWDFTELQVRISDRKTALQVDRIIRDALSQFKPEVIYNKVRVSREEIVAHVLTSGFLTHRVELLCVDHRKPRPFDRPRIAIIIDDLGYDLNMAKAFTAGDLPLTLSLLPLAPHVEPIAREANVKGYELMLHLPMEPNGYPGLNPGPGALLTQMTEGEIRRAMRNHLKRIPGVHGVNNHMGSYFTQRADKVGIVLGELKKSGLFYVDSRTTTQTVAFDLAKRMGVPAAKRSIFLDNDLSPKALKFQMERLLGIARHSGRAVGIGHPHRETLQLLNQYSQRLRTDFQVVPVSELVS
jgi:polysaccharide deacetylase 2 family uncharacterized protein YibQ